MSKAGTSDSIIIEQINKAGLDARPTSEQIASLKAQGVSEAVLQAMNTAPLHASQEPVVEYVGGYPYPYYPYYYYGYPYYYGYGAYYGWPYWGPYYSHYYHPYYGYPYHGGYYYGHGYGSSVHTYRAH